ncbi:MAG: SprT family zinc-dependent metalloprotease [Woeseiaceae bacterium]|nr:SprT family zinc-dependent metalloprotease [Woeseiaceae bacterium]
MQRAARQLDLFPEQPAPGPEPAFTVRESKRARRLSIKVFPRGRVEVVVPKRTRPADVAAFVDEHRQWIDETRAAFARQFPPEPFRLPQTVNLAAIGREMRIRYEPDGSIRGVRYRTAPGEVVLRGQTDDPSACVDALKRWLAGVAKAEFGPWLAALAAETGNAFRRMQVRGQKTCWGSHSARGTISINYCLLFLEPQLVRYLMIHELCHARHMNHSRRFWQYVRRFEPDYRRLDRALGEGWQAVPVWLGFH